MKRYLALILALLMCLSLCACGSDPEATPSSTAAKAEVENESEAESAIPTDQVPVEGEKPADLKKNGDGLYELNNAQDLVRYRELLEDEMRATYEDVGHDYSASSGAILMDDIDMSTVCNKELGSWRPIGFEAVTTKKGNVNSGDLQNSVFDGNGHTISGLYVADGTMGGLFYCLWDTQVRDLTFANCQISVVCGHAGTLAVELKDCTLNNVCVESDVTISVKGENERYHYFYVGGIAGFASEQNTGVTIENCKNYGTITSEEDSYVGGIVGGTDGIVDLVRCENYGYISCGGSGGGIVGETDGGSYYYGLVIGCINYGTVEANNGGKGGNVGGIVGINGSTVKCCVNAGTVSGNLLCRAVGANDAFLYNCLNVGSVSGEEAMAFQEDEGISVSAGDAGLTDGSVVAKLNEEAKGEFWIQGEAFPIWSGLIEQPE